MQLPWVCMSATARRILSRMRYLYVPGNATFLAERWLLREAGGPPVCLITDPDARDKAEQLRTRHPVAVRVAALSSDPSDFPDATRVVLPVSTNSVPLRYQPPVQQPDITPLYPLIRTLRRLGFREFMLDQPAGEKLLEVPHLLDDFAGRHRGQRCFVIGNGPSLNDIDMIRLKGEITLGANRCYLGYRDWGFPFRYWGIYDPLQIEEYALEYEANIPADTVKFFPFFYLPYLQMENACPLNIAWPREAWRQFSDSPDHIFRGYSVLYMLLQVALVMGCNPIILIGLDHRYHITKRYWFTRMTRMCGRWLTQHYEERPWYQNGKAAADAWFRTRQATGPSAARIWQANDAGGPTHFDNRYTSERKRFLMPRPQDAEADYRCARQWAEAHGVQILNATPNTALDVFEKVEFNGLF